MKHMSTKLLLTSVLVASSFGVSANQQWENESKDAWIDGKAESTLLLNTSLNSFEIDTEVKDQVVTLSGRVDNAMEKSLAQELVEGLDGVESVDNQLSVASSETKDKQADESSDTMAALTDSKITTIVKTRLLMDSAVSGTDIEVETQDQTVTLSGQVESDTQQELALTIAKNTNDVKNVVNKLEVVQ